MGDAVLGLVIADELFKRCPEIGEGELTTRRAGIVREESLALLAAQLDLGKHLSLGRGEDISGGRERPSNLAAGIEALFGAIFLDKGFSFTRTFIVRLIAADLDRVVRLGVALDPKSELQQLVHAARQGQPLYREILGERLDDDGLFLIEVLVNRQVVGVGKGKSKLDAEREAAIKAIQVFNSSPRRES